MSKAFGLNLFAKLVRSVTFAFAALATLGFLFVTVPVQQAEAGSKSHVSGKKFKMKRSGVKKVRSGHRMLRASSGNRNFHNGSKTRTYTKRRSVLNGEYGSNRIAKRRIKNHRIENRRVGERRSGVKSEVTYMSGHSQDYRKYRYGKKHHRKANKHRGMRQLAGSGTRVKRTRINSDVQLTTRYTSNNVVIITGAPSAYREIAGGGASAGDDCAYGTYCTVDLGGPKIITFNDNADIRDGEYVDGGSDAMSEEDYLREYGSK